MGGGCVGQGDAAQDLGSCSDFDLTSGEMNHSFDLNGEPLITDRFEEENEPQTQKSPAHSIWQAQAGQ